MRVLAIDQGTTNTKALLIGADGSVLLGYRNVGNYAGAMHLATPFLLDRYERAAAG